MSRGPVSPWWSLLTRWGLDVHFWVPFGLRVPPPFIFLEPGGKASALPLGSPGRQRHVDAFPRKSVLQWYGRYDPLGLIAMPLRMRVYGSFVDISALA